MSKKRIVVVHCVADIDFNRHQRERHLLVHQGDAGDVRGACAHFDKVALGRIYDCGLNLVSVFDERRRSERFSDRSVPSPLR